LPAARAALGKEVAGHIRVRTELARDTGAALATLFLPARLIRDIGLLPARRGQRRVRRSLRRLAPAGLELRDARKEHADLLEELVDRRLQRVVLLEEILVLFEEILVQIEELVDLRQQRQHQPLLAGGVERIDPLGWHPELESRRGRPA